ncbi:MAG TPA: transglutaminase family protein, partial [Chitinophagaceae bacterium]|nr:transglutaminase family protein [Chitinophagaceae bacterium]
QWSVSGHHDLMLGALLVCKFLYPELSTTPVLQEIEKVRRNIWLELNNYLTPLEQINIVTSILYSYYGLKGSETNYKEPNEFLLHKVLEAKHGNQISNGILYLILCELLDIPVKAIGVPKQFVIAYFKPGYSEENLPNPLSKIEFFIDPTSGQAFTHKDVENYFKRITVPLTGAYFKPQTNKRMIQQLLEELSKCFDDEKNRYKQTELNQLARLLD